MRHSTAKITKTETPMPYTDPEKARESKRAYYWRHRAEVIERTSAWRRANPESMRKATRKWARENPDRVKDSGLRHRYGIGLSEYTAMHEAQGGKCGICLRPKRLCVDHDHATTRVRGLLCVTCNQAIGMLDDDPALLFRAIRYLSQGGFECRPSQKSKQDGQEQAVQAVP
jgi:hypothetical protein